MVDINYSKKFSCPKCGTIGAIYVLKVSGNQIIVKQRCPVHGGVSFKVPLKEKDKFIHLISDAVFRCFKCGQKATPSSRKISGPWTLIQCTCPTHGRISVQKIWSSIYSEISSERAPTPQPSQTQTDPSEEGKKFCPNCGDQLTGAGSYCGTCGSELE